MVPRAGSSCGVLHLGGVAPPERFVCHPSQGRLFQTRILADRTVSLCGLEQPRRPEFRTDRLSCRPGGPVNLPRPRSPGSEFPRNRPAVRIAPSRRVLFRCGLLDAVVEHLHLYPFVGRVPRARSSCGALHRSGVAPLERLACHTSQGRLFQTRFRHFPIDRRGGTGTTAPAVVTPRRSIGKCRRVREPSVLRSSRSNSPPNHTGLLEQSKRPALCFLAESFSLW
jgi:hypothetical protein